MWSSDEQYHILANSSMGLSELKILDAYIKKISSFPDGKMLVVLKKSELEEALGIEKINLTELSKRIDCLFEQRVPVMNGTIETLKDTPLFERCELKRDVYGIWTCYLLATSLGISSLFPENVKRRIADRFDTAKKLTSRYSYLMYRYLDDCSEMDEWEVDLEELKGIIGCKKESYDSFKAFNSIVMKKCQKEIFEVTGLLFDYELIRYIRKVVGIRFIVRNQEKDEARITEAQNEISRQQHKENIDFYNSACDNEFSDDEIDLIISVLAGITIPKSNKGYSVAQFDYLREKYISFKIYANKKQEDGSPIKHRFDYFLKMLKNERDKQQ